MSILGSALGGFFQGRAADQAADSVERSQNRAIDLYERIYEDQMGRNEPFRQLELQQANAFGELFGFDPVGQPAQSGQSQPQNAFVAPQGANEYGAYVLENPDLYRAFNGLSGSNERSIGRQGYDLNGDGNLSLEEYGQFHFDRHGRGEGRELPNAFAASPTNATAGLGRDLTMPTTTGQPAQAANDGGRSRFENSIFYDLGQIGLNGGGGTGDPYDRFMNSAFAQVARSGADRDIDRIDSALGAQGGLFSSSRQAHADDAFADRMGGAFADFINNDRFAANQQQNAFGNYLGALMGSPPQGATNNANFLASSFANQAGNGFTNIGNANAQRAIGMGNAWTGGIQNIQDTAQFALGMFG